MSPFKFIVLLLTILSCYEIKGLEANDKDGPIELGVYFESLCPDSRRFFVNQLVPTFKQIGKIIKPTLIPFGHARVLGNNKMVCQHGARECEGNRLMACIIARESDSLSVIETIGCIIGNKVAPKDCVTKHLPNASFDDIDRCKASDESYQMMIEFEKLTGKPDYIPKLTLNGQYSEDIQSELEFNLKNFVCKNYNGTKPSQC